jgi:hypothetical protein
MGAPAGQPGTGNTTTQLPQGTDTMPSLQSTMGSSMGGSKGTGQPVVGYGGNATTTPMGTPIVYGKNYLNQSNFSSNPQNPANIVKEPEVIQAADGTTDVQPKYFEDGTTGVDDPWAWVSQQKPVAPLAATIQPSQEQPSGGAPQDPLTQMAEAGAINATAKGMEAGFKAYGAPLSQTTTAVNTLGQGATLTNAGAAPLAAGEAASMYALTPTLTAAPIGGAGLGLGTGAASGIGAGLGAGAGTAAATGTAAAGTGAATAGLGAAGAAGGQAALAAMGPVGWAIGAGLLAKKMGIF